MECKDSPGPAWYLWQTSPEYSPDCCWVEPLQHRYCGPEWDQASGWRFSNRGRDGLYLLLEGFHLYGVGFSIKNTILPSLTETPVGISERLMTLRIPLAKKRYATLLSAYAPTLPSENEAKECFYLTLDEALFRIPKSDKILLLGDFNARVGQNNRIWSGVLGRHGIGRVNANGMRLLTLCSEHNLAITNTIFQQKASIRPRGCTLALNTGTWLILSLCGVVTSRMFSSLMSWEVQSAGQTIVWLWPSSIWKCVPLAAAKAQQKEAKL